MKQGKQETGALVPAVQSLPVAQSMNISESGRERLVERFRKEAESEIGWHASKIRVGRYVGGTIVAAGTGLAVIAPPSIVVLPIMIALYGSLFVGLGAWNEKILEESIVKRREGATKYSLTHHFHQVQKEAYQEQKRMIMQAAEQHLAAGKLVSMQEAAWLAALDPFVLEKATDQLAVTVLQMRKLLAYQRCNTLRVDGGRDMAQPLTIASMEFNPAIPLHRSILREKLFDADDEIAEDSNPVLKNPELVAPDKVKTGFLKSMGSFFRFRGMRSVRKEFIETALPEFKDVEVPILHPVDDFIEALEAYEAQNPPLDLPALRGWGKPRKALAGPKPFGAA